MNYKCEYCEAEEAVIYCYDCSKAHSFCKACFDFMHKNDIKKAHKTTTEISAKLSKTESNSTLFCSAHPKQPIGFVLPN